MSTTRNIALAFSGPFVLAPSMSAAVNSASPGAVQAPVTLASGDNTIAVPTGGSVHTAVSIVKPSTNTALLKLKGVGGDTGVALHKTDPDSISLDPTVASFIVNASASAPGIVFIWS